ncbi:MAG: hypothetical protein Kow0059_22010 [Candidatus Sumerlaeia bacterium]
MNFDQPQTMPEQNRALRDLLRTHAQALERLERFCEEHPYIIAPNVVALLRHNLEDNQEILRTQGGGGGVHDSGK